MPTKLASRWIFRAILIIALALMTYVSLLPKYDFTEWVPNQLLNALGVPLGLSWWLNDKADKVAHFFGGFILMVLFLYSKLKQFSSYKTNDSIKIYLLILFCLALGTEIAQFQIGRKFSVDDIVASVFGGILAIVLHRLTSRISVSRQFL